GTVAHENSDWHEHHRARDEHDAERPAPALGDGQLRHRWNEDELTGACGGAERADDHAAVGAEPAMSHRCTENAADRPRADADGKTPQQIHLPEIAHEDETEKATDDKKAADEHNEPHTGAVDQRSTERAVRSAGEDAER